MNMNYGFDMDNVKRNTYSELLEFQLAETVSDNVKRYIFESGFTAQELSYRSNLSVPTINRLKAGEHLSIRGICALAEALNKQPEAFFVRAD